MSQQRCLSVTEGKRRKDEDEATAYLRHVREQARSLPDVSEAHSVALPNKKPRLEIPGKVSRLSVSRFLPQTAETTSTIRLSSAWIQQTLENFRQLATYLQKCRSHGVGGKESNRIPVPAMKDRDGWRTFLSGRSQHTTIREDEEETTDVPAPWQTHLPPSGYRPTVSLLLQMDQVMVRRVLSHCSIHETPSCWIYALLASLDRPIHRDDACVLYQLVQSMMGSEETDHHVLLVILIRELEQGDKKLIQEE